MSKKQYLLTVVLAVVAGFVGGVGSSWFLMGSPVFAQKTAEPAKVIRAERFEVVDKDGKNSAWFGIRGDGEPALSLLDKNGKARVGFVLVEGEPSLVLYDKNGKIRAGLDESRFTIHDQDGKVRIGFVLVEGEPALSLFDKDEKFSAVLGIRGDGMPVLSLSDKDEKSRTTLTQSGLGILDENEKTRAMLSLSHGMPVLSLRDENGKGRTMLGLADGMPILELSDKDAKRRAVVLALPDGEPRLVLFGEDEKVMWEAPYSTFHLDE